MSHYLSRFVLVLTCVFIELGMPICLTPSKQAKACKVSLTLSRLCSARPVRPLLSYARVLTYHHGPVVLIAGVVAVVLNLIIPAEEEPVSNIVEQPEGDVEGGHERDEESMDETKKERDAERRVLG
jgi:hypothetical protein